MNNCCDAADTSSDVENLIIKYCVNTGRGLGRVKNKTSTLSRNSICNGFVALGPLPPLAGSSSAAAQLHQTSHSCIVQYFQ
jgi:hypothetical protein